MSALTTEGLRRRKRLEVLVPMLLLLLSGGILFSAALALIRDEASQNESMRIVEGEQGFHVFQDEVCVGSLQSALHKGRLLQWQLKGDLFLREQGKVHAAKLELNSFFNPLQQLFRSVLRLSYQDALLSLSLADVHPIQVDLKASSAQFSFTRALRFPGPILLKEDTASKAGYYVSYPHSSAAFSHTPKAALESVVNELRLRLEETAATACEEPAAIDVSALRATLLQSTPKLFQQQLQEIL